MGLGAIKGRFRANIQIRPYMRVDAVGTPEGCKYLSSQYLALQTVLISPCIETQSVSSPKL